MVSDRAKFNTIMSTAYSPGTIIDKICRWTFTCSLWAFYITAEESKSRGEVQDDDDEKAGLVLNVLCTK